MKVIDGRALAATIEEKIKQTIVERNIRPSLASLFIGDAEDSALYTKRKAEAAARLGVDFFVEHLPSDVSLEEVEKKIEALNTRPALDGYIIQLPLPEKLRTETDRLLNLIRPDRDVDGLTEINRRRLLGGQHEAFYPTPIYAVGMLLAQFGDTSLESQLQFLCEQLPRLIPTVLKEKKATIISNGDVFGQTLQYLLEQAGMQVVLERSDSASLQSSLENSSLVVTAVGRPGFLKDDMLSSEAIVIDVGTTLVDGKTKGDLDWESVQEKNIVATPVPGGVGPVTVAMLYANLLFLKLQK